MLAIHLFLYAAKEYYDVTGANDILCNIKGALYTFERKIQKNPGGHKNNDIQRVLWQVKSKMKSLHLLHHVNTHQDNYRKTLQPTIIGSTKLPL